MTVGDGAALRCAACDAQSVDVFHRQADVPLNSCLLVESRHEALAFPTGRIELGFCSSCGFIGNLAFDQALTEYSDRYEETQAYSDRFVSFARQLAKRWVDEHDLHGRTVLEIGCGKGEFLVMMIEAGAGGGVGIDPGVHPERLSGDAANRIRWIADFYTEAYRDLRSDAVVCRHTLEHISDVSGFMTTLRRAIGDRTDTAVLFELPDVQRVLQEGAFWDVYYEHCSYFTAGSLVRLFRRTGFDVLDVELDYDDQYLLLSARPSAGVSGAIGSQVALEDDLAATSRGVTHFRSAYDDAVSRWRDVLHRIRSDGGRAVIWGGGSKGVAFLTAMGDGIIEYAVDVNPHKQGRFIAGGGQQVVAPAFLCHYRPDLVIAMNPIYRREIARELDTLGVSADLQAV